jgi:hypothetical protein
MQHLQTNEMVDFDFYLSTLQGRVVTQVAKPIYCLPIYSV